MVQAQACQCLHVDLAHAKESAERKEKMLVSRSEGRLLHIARRKICGIVKFERFCRNVEDLIVAIIGGELFEGHILTWGCVTHMRYQSIKRYLIWPTCDKLLD